jgi:hypothetical protein
MESRKPMPKLLSHSDYWRLQAQEARLAAQRLEDPVARADLLAKADEYDRFAAWAVLRGPNFLIVRH